MGTVDFSLPGALLSALLVGAFQPVLLWLITRIPTFAGRNPIEFLLSFIAALVVWAVAITVFAPLRPADVGEALVGLFALGGAGLLYLEIWGLMSRGYTLSILIALLEADGPLVADEIAQRYRGGDGLDWIMRHRLVGLEGAGAIERQVDRITLTRPLGLFIARLYATCIAILGLRKTG